MIDRPDHIAVVILTAGRSERMGTDKAFLMLDNNRTFLGNLIETYRNWGCREIVLVTNTRLESKIKKAFPDTRVVVNNHLDYGRFYSVWLGFNTLESPEYCFVQNIDNPLTEQELLDLLYLNREFDSTVVPVFKGRGGHPVLAGKKVIEVLMQHEKMDDNLRGFLYSLKVKRVETDIANVLTNINDRSEYDNFVKKNNP